MRAILGNGIFLAEGDEWLSQRRSAARSFQGCQLRRMTAAMQEAVGALQQRWTPMAARAAVIDLIPELMRLTLDILMRTLLDRTRVVQGKSVSVRVDRGCRRLFKNKITNQPFTSSSLTT